MILFRQAGPSAQRPLPAPPFHAWELADGRVWLAFHRLSGAYLLRFPGLADFEVALDGREVECRPVPECREAVVRHLYQNQVWPLALSRQGRLMFHGSAVDLGGVAVAFLGPSHRGKSTLAASFSLEGHPILTDDGLWIERGEEGPVAQPGFPSLGLWDDSSAALGLAGRPEAGCAGLPPKLRFAAEGQVRHSPHPRRLARMFFLGAGEAAAPRITPLGPREAFLELTRLAFILDVEDRAALAGQFEELARLSGEPIYHGLDFPRRFERLPSVRRAVLEHLGGVGGKP